MSKLEFKNYEQECILYCFWTDAVGVNICSAYIRLSIALRVSI